MKIFYFISLYLATVAIVSILLTEFGHITRNASFLENHTLIVFVDDLNIVTIFSSIICLCVHLILLLKGENRIDFLQATMVMNSISSSVLLVLLFYSIVENITPYGDMLFMTKQAVLILNFIYLGLPIVYFLFYRRFLSREPLSNMTRFSLTNVCSE